MAGAPRGEDRAVPRLPRPGEQRPVHGIQFHHLVSREDHGDDYATNLVPLCPSCHDLVTRRNSIECRLLLETSPMRSTPT
jgi:5-methylcytosine-specific restriction endonuclease McrA